MRKNPGLTVGGVDADYTRLERGDLSGVSEGVLDALRALQLDDAERAHLFDLARAAGPVAKRPRRSAPKLDPARRAALARCDHRRARARPERPLGHPWRQPACTRPVLRAVPRPDTAGQPRPLNFQNPRAHDLDPDWERGADDAVALLRAEAGRDPYDRELTDLIGELSTRSEEFRARWVDHNVRLHQTGAKRFHHPVVGELTLTFEMMELAADPA